MIYYGMIAITVFAEDDDKSGGMAAFNTSILKNSIYDAAYTEDDRLRYRFYPVVTGWDFQDRINRNYNGRLQQFLLMEFAQFERKVIFDEIRKAAEAGGGERYMLFRDPGDPGEFESEFKYMGIYEAGKFPQFPSPSAFAEHQYFPNWKLLRKEYLSSEFDHGIIQAYLRRLEFQEVRSPYTSASLFQRGKYQLLVPHVRTFADYGIRMDEMLSNLTRITKLPRYALIHELKLTEAIEKNQWGKR